MSSDPKLFISAKVATLMITGCAIGGAAVVTFLLVYALWTGELPTRSGSIDKIEHPAAFWTFITLLQIMGFCLLWGAWRFHPRDL